MKGNEDIGRSIFRFEQALENDSENFGFLKTLVDLYAEVGNYAKAKSCLERALLHADGEPPEELASMHLRFARLAETHKQPKEALKQYACAFKLDPGSYESLQGLALLLYREKDYARSLRAHKMLLERFGSRLDLSQLVEVYFRLARIQLFLGDRAEAEAMFEKGLELAPASERTLDAAISFYESLGNFEKAAKLKQKRLVRVPEGDTTRNWRELARYHLEKLEDLDGALDCYYKAMKSGNPDAGLMAEVADLLISVKRYEEGLGLLKAALKQENDPERKVEWNLRMARIAEEHMDDPAEAASFTLAACSLDPERAGLLTRLEPLLEARKCWDKLEQLYAFEISMCAENDKARKIATWKKLGDMLFYKAGRREDGVKAWKVVLGMVPNDESVKNHIAELYAYLPEKAEVAMAYHRDILANDPDRLSSLRALWKIFMAQDRFDAAHCVGARLARDGDESAEAVDFYVENAPDQKTQAMGQLDRNTWVHAVLHEDCRVPVVGQILWLVYSECKNLMDSTLKTEDVQKRYRLNLKEETTLCNTIRYVHETLDLPRPEFYLKPEYNRYVKALPVQPPAVVLGGDAFEDFPRRELTFLMAAHGVLARPDVLLACEKDPEFIQLLLDAAGLVVDPGHEPMSDRDEAEAFSRKMAKQIKRKNREALEDLVYAYQKLGRIDLKKWARGLKLSAFRAGLVLSADLNLALRTLHAYPCALESSELEEIDRDLRDYAVSEEYFHVRKELKLAIV